MKIVCTICSKRKREDTGLLPARLRYTAPHIAATEKIAKENGEPFYILSGKYGVISGDTNIPNYDYYLEMNAVEPLSKVIAEQLEAERITEVDFYTEQKPTWAPYEKAITEGASLAGALLHVHPLT